METELLNYIESLIKSDVGFIYVDPKKLPIERLSDLLTFLNNHCWSKAIINEQTLANFKLNFNSIFIDKSRSFYLSGFDFDRLDIPLLNTGNTAYLPSKESNGVNIFEDAFVKRGEFWFCTNDEFMIVKNSKQ